VITALEIENFKGIGKRVRVEFRPITLLFGANSAGKSTIIQALHYARELLEHNNPNPDHTIAGGEAVELGGFRSLVHNHDLMNPVAIRFELDLSGTDLSWPKIGEFTVGSFDFSAKIQSATVEIRARWSGQIQATQISSYIVTINGEPLGKVDDLDGGQATAFINPQHSLFVVEASGTGDEVRRSAIADLLPQEPTQVDPFCRAAFVRVPSPYSVLPAWDEPVGIMAVKGQEGVAEEEVTAELEYELSSILEQLLVGPGRILRDELRAMRYVGPLREIPPRNYEPALTADESRWASGLGAWDTLHRVAASSLERLNWWLVDEDRLKAGYRVRRMSYKELDLESPLMVALMNDRAFDEYDSVAAELRKQPTRQRVLLVEERSGIEILPQDVGVGISQLLPVVVAALEASPELVVIEQPELHVHPAVQVALGDLFISQVKNHARQFLIETHSEHLILRLLRRIRETGELESAPEEIQITADEVAVHYIEQQTDGANITRLRIDSTGEFIDRWPKGFFEERGEELF
jgi:hypothetical protein